MLGDMIRDRLDGRSHGWLAQQLGVSRPAVTRWCLGTSRPSTANLTGMAAVFGLGDVELGQWLRAATAAINEA